MTIRDLTRDDIGKTYNVQGGNLMLCKVVEEHYKWPDSTPGSTRRWIFWKLTKPDGLVELLFGTNKISVVCEYMSNGDCLEWGDRIRSNTKIEEVNHGGLRSEING
jgi:hypothetical protein